MIGINFAGMALGCLKQNLTVCMGEDGACATAEEEEAAGSEASPLTLFNRLGLGPAAREKLLKPSMACLAF